MIVMTTSEVPAAYVDGEAERDQQGRDDQEAAADPEEPGEQADGGGGDQHLERPRALAGEGRAEGDDRVVEPLGARPAGRRRRRRRHRHWRTASSTPTPQHQHGEGGEQHGLGDQRRGLRAGDGAADRDDPEGDAPREQHVAGPVAPSRAPISDVTPTTTSDPVVACAGAWSSGRPAPGRPGSSRRRRARPG